MTAIEIMLYLVIRRTQTMYDMEKLRFIVSLYCDMKNMIYESYMDGLLSKGELNRDQIKTLIQYHSEWVKK